MATSNDDGSARVPRRDRRRGVTILKPRLVFGTQANSAVRLALLGCSGRGTNVSGSFIEATTPW